MQWHVSDIPVLIHNIPHALHDMMQHEDPEIVKKGLAGLTVTKPLISTPPAISIEKTLDPLAQRSAQNIGLLLHDYINQLPSFDVSNAEGEKLLKHWQEILLEQPQRLAEAKRTHWHDESSKAFWHDKIAGHHKEVGLTRENFPDSWDDWQRAAGIGHDIGSVKQLSAMHDKQWKDIMIRSRLHKQTMALWEEL